MYDCPCGKQHKSRDTVRRHKNDPRRNKESYTDDTGPIVKLDLKPEYDKMAEIIEPKKKEPEKTDAEPKFECGTCHGKFNERVKYCPHCGVEFA